jgi:hypothetical protein
MAPLTISHVARAMAMDDPLGIKNVSGFYGPGAWIAYSLTLATSWVAVIRNDQAHNLHHIGYLFYVNWAAIDLIRTFALHATGPATGANGSVAAALSVTWWGVAHATSQFAMSFFQGGLSNAHGKPKARRRCTLLELGIVLPLVANLMAQIAGPDQMIPALYWDGMGRSYDFSGYTSGILLLPMACLLLDFEKSRFFSGTVDCSDVSVAWLGIGLIPILLSVTYIFRVVASGGAIWTKSCFFMPCAPSSLVDWDQAFNALVGVIMVLYELGPCAMIFLRQKLDRLIWP